MIKKSLCRYLLCVLMMSNIAISLYAAEKVYTDDYDPEIVSIYTVDESIIAIRVDAQKVVYGKQEPYIKDKKDKIISYWKSHIMNGFVKRDGKVIGGLVGKDKDILCTFDRLIGKPLNVDEAEKTKNYTISSSNDSNYTIPVTPLNVYLKSKPNDYARVGEWEFEYPATHIIYIKVKKKLIYGADYTIHFKLKNNSTVDLSFTYKPDQTVSEAIHVSQIGFTPDSPAKIAFLSIWLGTGGKHRYDPVPAFHLINDTTGKKTYSGTLTTAKSSDDNEPGRYGKNYNKTDVYEMDFSTVTTPGTYRIYVEGVGLSNPVIIADDIWDNAFLTACRGFYHQRSGIALQQPYTVFERPRAFHPDDGIKIYQSSYSFLDLMVTVANNNGDTFDMLYENKTHDIVPNAWGGYMDAGDWDRNINHLDATLLQLELYELFPDYFSTIDLNIPESSDNLPDIINEALWNIDFFKRLQMSNGAVRGGIESAEHPQFGEMSHQESLPVMAYAPDIYSTYAYVAAAARAAWILQSLDEDLSEDYEESALKGMNWANSELRRKMRKLDSDHLDLIEQTQNLANLELYRLTGTQSFHTEFLKTTRYNRRSTSDLKNNDPQTHAAFLYLRIKNRTLDRGLVSSITQVYKDKANILKSRISSMAFRYSDGLRGFIGWGSVTSGYAIDVLRAHYITGDTKYLKAAIQSCQYSLGANPVNMCFTTGMGYNPPAHPLVVDSRIQGTEAPPGLTVYGPIDFKEFSKYIEPFMNFGNDKCIPHPTKWPCTEAYFDVYLFPDICEYTIAEQMGPITWTWGYLSAVL